MRLEHILIVIFSVTIFLSACAKPQDLPISNASHSATPASPEKPIETANQQNSNLALSNTDVVLENQNSKKIDADDQFFETDGTIDGQPVIVRIISLERDKNAIVTLRVKVINEGKDKISGVRLYAATSESYLADTKEQKKYSVVRDKIYNPLSSELGSGIAAGESLEQFAQFTAPPVTTTAVTVYYPGASPVADVPILK